MRNKRKESSWAYTEHFKSKSIWTSAQKDPGSFLMFLILVFLCWLAKDLTSQPGCARLTWVVTALFTWHALREGTGVWCHCLRIPLTVFTQNIRTPSDLTILVLNFEQVQLLLVSVSKHCWMSGKQCGPWSDAAFWSGLTLFAQASPNT